MSKKVANSKEGVDRDAVVASWTKKSAFAMPAKVGVDDKKQPSNSPPVTKAQQKFIKQVNDILNKVNGLIATAGPQKAVAKGANKAQPQPSRGTQHE